MRWKRLSCQMRLKSLLGDTVRYVPVLSGEALVVSDEVEIVAVLSSEQAVSPRRNKPANTERAVFMQASHSHIPLYIIPKQEQSLLAAPLTSWFNQYERFSPDK